MTTMTATLIKRTIEYDVEQIIDSIVLAFSSDPLARWVYPSPQQYLKSFPDFVKIIDFYKVNRLTRYFRVYLPSNVRRCLLDFLLAIALRAVAQANRRNHNSRDIIKTKSIASIEIAL